MKALSALFLFFLLVAACALSPCNAAAQVSSRQTAALERMQRKLDYLQKNAEQRHPNPAPTVITEEEANAYVASGRVKLPVGVKSLAFSGAPGVITGNARVDFDELTAARRSSNPMLSLFTGVHNIRVVAHANGAAGVGRVNVDSVSLDDTEIPRFVLQLFVSHYLQPRYPNVGLENTFPLPARIDNATVGEHKLTVGQK